MFSISRRLSSFSKLRIVLTLFVLLLIALAFTNFFILMSLRTNIDNQNVGLLQPVFLIRIRGNGSDVRKESEEKNSQDISRRLNRRRNSQFNIKMGESSIERTKIARSTEARNIVGSTLSTLKKSKTSQKINVVKSTRSTADANGDCAAWCRRGDGLKPPYLLTAVLLVRIYRHDLANLSSREMVQWLQYLRYAGFQHVYVYDAFVKPSESQRDVIEPFVQSGFATYIDWSEHNPYTIQGTQVAAYQNCIDKFGRDFKWQAAIDIDEYPFSPSDLNENFMSRFLTKYSRENPDVSEITMKNYLMLGKPIDDEIEPLLIARIRRRTHEPANALVKPIYKPGNIGWAQVHHNGVKIGSSRDAPEQMLRMNHYWGARLQNWGDDTPKVLDMTRPDYSIEPIVERIKRCTNCLGKDGLFVKRWA